jgi:two-component system response regulator PilR (NtrC family)
MITPNELPPLLGKRETAFAFDAKKPLKEAVADFEREYISHMMRLHSSKDEVAKALNISLSSLYRKIEELGITPQR